MALSSGPKSDPKSKEVLSPAELAAWNLLRCQLKPPGWLAQSKGKEIDLSLELGKAEVAEMMVELSSKLFSETSDNDQIFRLMTKVEQVEAALPRFALSKEERLDHCLQEWRAVMPAQLRSQLDEAKTQEQLGQLIESLRLLPPLAQYMQGISNFGLGKKLTQTALEPAAVLDGYLVDDALLRQTAVKRLNEPKKALEKLERAEFLALWEALLAHPYLADLLSAKPELLQELDLPADEDLNFLLRSFPEQAVAIKAQAPKLLMLRKEPGLLAFLLEKPGLLNLLAKGESAKVIDQLGHRFNWANDVHSWRHALLSELSADGPRELITAMSKAYDLPTRDLFDAEWGQSPDANLLNQHFLHRHGRLPKDWQIKADQAIQLAVDLPGLNSAALLAAPEHQEAVAQLIKLSYGVKVAAELFKENDSSVLRRDYLPNHRLRGILFALSIGAEYRDSRCGILISQSDLVPELRNAADFREVNKLIGQVQVILERPEIRPLAAQGEKFFKPLLAQVPIVAHSGKLPGLNQAEYYLKRIYHCPLSLALISRWHQQTKAGFPLCLAALIEALNQFQQEEQQAEKREAIKLAQHFQQRVPRPSRWRLLKLLGKNWWNKPRGA